jgi:predicted negative regulator of RcsB-dependent stress response
VNAQKTLLNAEKLAKENKDWLYYAYNQTMLAKIKVAQRKYDDAYPLLRSALEYQELLNCPMGIAQGHLDFADFYLQKGDTPSAQRSFKQAQTLVQDRNLKQVFVLLTEMEQRLAKIN